jgi:hypothetical protein
MVDGSVGGLGLVLEEEEAEAESESEGVMERIDFEAGLERASNRRGTC